MNFFLLNLVNKTFDNPVFIFNLIKKKIFFYLLCYTKDCLIDDKMIA